MSESLRTEGERASLRSSTTREHWSEGEKRARFARSPCSELPTIATPPSSASPWDRTPTSRDGHQPSKLALPREPGRLRSADAGHVASGNVSARAIKHVVMLWSGLVAASLGPNVMRTVMTLGKPTQAPKPAKLYDEPPAMIQDFLAHTIGILQQRLPKQRQDGKLSLSTPAIETGRPRGPRIEDQGPKKTEITHCDVVFLVWTSVLVPWSFCGPT